MRADRSRSKPFVSCRSRPSCWNERGFTLIELLIALTLVGLILVLMANGLRLSNRVWDTAGSIQNGSAQVRLVQELLRDLIEGAAVPRPGEPRSDAGDRRGFIGSPERISFFGPLPVQRRHAAQHRLTLEHVRRGSSGQMVLSWSPTPWSEPRGRTDPAPDHRILIDQVSELRISYLASAQGDGAKGWQDRWIDSNTLPLLIRIEVTVTGTTGGFWPALLIAPRLSSTQR